MPETSNSQYAYCNKFSKSVTITNSCDLTQNSKIKFDNAPKCSDKECDCKECTASNWYYRGVKKQYWELK